MQAGFHQAKNWLAPQFEAAVRPGLGCVYYRHIGVSCKQGTEQARGKVKREQRTVTGHGQQEPAVAKRQPGFKARQRARKILYPIGKHQCLTGAKAGFGLYKVKLGIPVGIDQQPMEGAIGLGSQAFQGMLDQGLAAKRLQPLVHPAHARATPAGKHQRCDVTHPEMR